MIGRRIVLACVIAGPVLVWQTHSPAPMIRASSARIVDSAVAVERRFLATWYVAWMASQFEQHGSIRCDGPGKCRMIRTYNLHCHFAYTQLGAQPDQHGLIPKRSFAYIPPERFIKSRFSEFAVCPDWDPSDPPTPDERIRLDRALTASHQADIRQARESLIGVLQQAARAAPESDFVVGQLVRFLVDQGDFTRAADAANGCGATRWWCLSLRGYVMARSGDVARSDSVYQVATSAMAASERCAWNDVSVLLDAEARKAYERVSCANREAKNDTIWWLADPFYSEPGNERRVEQQVRRTVLALHSALDRDERYDWRPRLGNDARVAMIGRYGWPAYVFWIASQDTDHTHEFLKLRGSPPNEPYTTYEYPHGRIHTVPRAKALADPYHSVNSDWELTDAQKPVDPLWPEHPWWPQEHFAARAPLVQLPATQTAMLRRQDDIVLGVAMNLDPDSIGRPGTATINRMMLLVTRGPDSVQKVAEHAGVVGAPAVFWGRIPTGPALAAVEFPAMGPSLPGGRTRYGITPPAPLSALAPHELAISNPVILQAASDGDEFPASTDSALARMAGSLRVQPVGRIGIYWETYGFTPKDTVEFSVWIERHTPQGIARRFSNSVRITQDLNTPIATTWEAMPGGGRYSLIAGPVPIIGRSVSIDVSHLAKGSYWLDVAAKVAGRDAVRGRTEIVVQ